MGRGPEAQNDVSRRRGAQGAGWCSKAEARCRASCCSDGALRQSGGGGGGGVSAHGARAGAVRGGLGAGLHRLHRHHPLRVSARNTARPRHSPHQTCAQRELVGQCTAQRRKAGAVYILGSSRACLDTVGCPSCGEYRARAFDGACRFGSGQDTVTLASATVKVGLAPSQLEALVKTAIRIYGTPSVWRRASCATTKNFTGPRLPPLCLAPSPAPSLRASVVLFSGTRSTRVLYCSCVLVSSSAFSSLCLTASGRAFRTTLVACGDTVNTGMLFLLAPTHARTHARKKRMRVNANRSLHTYAQIDAHTHLYKRELNTHILTYLTHERQRAASNGYDSAHALARTAPAESPRAAAQRRAWSRAARRGWCT